MNKLQRPHEHKTKQDVRPPANFNRNVNIQIALTKLKISK